MQPAEPQKTPSPSSGDQQERQQARPERDFAPSEPGSCGQTFSMSESLAHGLFKKFVAESDRAQAERAARMGPMTPMRTAKRAAAYRNARDMIRRSLPDNLYAGRIDYGDQSGKSKDSACVTLFWRAVDHHVNARGEAVDEQFMLCADVLIARDVASRLNQIAIVSRHAMMRLFYRLKTTDTAVVMRELNDLAGCASYWRPVLHCMPVGAEALLPSKHGAFGVTRDRDNPKRLAIKTWMDDDRMVDNLQRQRAVAYARSEDGFVLNVQGTFPIVSPQRLAAVSNRAPGSPWLLAFRPDPDEVNRSLDAQFDARSRLPAEYRFAPREKILADHEAQRPVRSDGDRQDPQDSPRPAMGWLRPRMAG